MSVFEPDSTTKEKYLHGKLTDDEEIAYELWLAGHPNELADLELDLMMQEGSKNLRPAQNQALITKTNHWMYAIPVLFLVLISTWLLIQQKPNVFNVELFKTRGASTDEIYITKPKDSWIELEIFPDIANRNYQLVVTGSISQQQLIIENLRAEEFQSVKAIIDPEKINDNKWEVQLIDNTGYVEQEFMVGVKNEVRHE